MSTDVTDCWLNRLEVHGELEDVNAFFQTMNVPDDVLAMHGAIGHPGLFGAKSFSGHVPPPPPSGARTVVQVLDAREHEVSATWAQEHWGCKTDIIEDTKPGPGRHGAMQITFFTYGGPPIAWCETAATTSCRSGHDVLLVLSSYMANGDMPSRAVLVECGSFGVMHSDYAEGIDNVHALLAAQDLLWDGLTIGPYSTAPYIPYIPRKA